MDRYIKMLLIKLSTKYDISIIHILKYNNEKNMFSNIFNVIIKNNGETVAKIDCYSKREVVEKLAKWQKD